MSAGPVHHRGSVPHEAYLGALASLDSMGNASLRVLLALGSPEQV